MKKSFCSIKNDFRDFIKSIQIKLKIKSRRKEVAFTKYVEIRKEIQKFLYELKHFNTSNLAIKYRIRHKMLIKDFMGKLDTFEYIYANKNVGISL